MKSIYLSVIALLTSAIASFGQLPDHLEYEQVPDLLPDTVVMPVSPLNMQVLFKEGDNVSTANGEAQAKGTHDFIGFTPDTTGEYYGFVSVNHEEVVPHDKIGGGGGMTVFAVQDTGNGLQVAERTLSNKQPATAKFHNINFVDTVGNTGMNCGGINSVVDGRIWTAEEWWRSDNSDLTYGDTLAIDTSDYTIGNTPWDWASGNTIKAYQNLNYMVEVDPYTAMAKRKQYNWGRQPFEGGVVMPDNKTVYLGADAVGGLFTKFVAEQEGDFTKGTLYAYTEDSANKWIELNNTSLDTMLHTTEIGQEMGATMFNRIEWVAVDTSGDHPVVYFSETGRDDASGGFETGMNRGGDLANHHIDRAAWQDANSPADTENGYSDYYGRVMKYDPEEDTVTSFLEGGSGNQDDYGREVAHHNYYNKHLTNPDGLNVMSNEAGDFLVICEDMNGTSAGRMPRGMSNRTCELWLLPLNDNTRQNPSVDDLIRLTATPLGTEVTGAQPSSDGKYLLVNSQHPSRGNPAPYNKSLTFAISGWSAVTSVGGGRLEDKKDVETFNIHPNPASRLVHLSKVTDVAIYNISGQRIKVERNTDKVDVAGLSAGTYVLRTEEGESKTLIVQ